MRRLLGALFARLRRGRARCVKRASLLTVASLLLPGEGLADGLIPGPSETGFDPALELKARRYDRQHFDFNAHLFGISIDALVSDNQDRSLLTQFLAQEAELDFLAFTTSLGTPRAP